MKLPIIRSLALLATASLGFLVGGCHPKVPEAPPLSQTSFPHLPDATNVTAALDQKDYQAAVEGLAKIKASIASPEQQQEYGTLAGEVREKISEASATEPKAAEALQAINFLISGR